jgi:hypothetical protein
MPLENGAGHSEDTAIKQRDFRYVLNVMLRVAQGCMNRHAYAHQEFLYFDLNAGPGFVDGSEGSPLIFVKEALELGLPFQAFFFELMRENADRLQLALESVCPPSHRDRLRVIYTDHNESVSWALKAHLAAIRRTYTYGLAYGDGNGKTDVPIKPMEALAVRFPQLDQLLNVNATIYKRLRGANPSASFLADDLAGIKKQHRLIRKPVGIHQWTMLFLTNWDRPPEFGQIGFRRLDSLEGQQIAEEVNFSRRERREKQRPFEGLPPTNPMLSTFGTPASWPFAPSSSSAAVASVSAAAGLERRSRIT